MFRNEGLLFRVVKLTENFANIANMILHIKKVKI